MCFITGTLSFSPKGTSKKSGKQWKGSFKTAKWRFFFLSKSYIEQLILDFIMWDFFIDKEREL